MYSLPVNRLSLHGVSYGTCCPYEVDQQIPLLQGIPPPVGYSRVDLSGICAETYKNKLKHTTVT